MHIGGVVSTLGILVMLFGLGMVVPTGVDLYYGTGQALHFILASLMVVGLGLVMRRIGGPVTYQLSHRDGFLIVSVAWVLLSILGAVPLWTTGTCHTFWDGFFESASGLTTTGSTVLTGLDGMPPAVLFWRSMEQWLGGMGIIVLAVAILPLLGIGGRSMFRAETPGPMKDSKLTPRIAQTAKALWLVYAGITLACAVSLHLAGMSWFDAVCQSFSAMSLGGFSPHDRSIGYYNSVPIEVVLSIFQVIAAGNFATYFLMLRHRSAKLYFADREMLGMLALLLASILGVSIYLWAEGTYPSFFTSLRYTSFNLITIGTDCGYANTNFGTWPLFAPMWMLFLSSILVCSGSTGGGIKMIRTMILAKQASREIARLLHPNAEVPVKIGTQVIENKVVFSVLAFIFLYFMTVVTLTFAQLISGMDFVSAFSSIIACINNAGPGLARSARRPPTPA